MEPIKFLLVHFIDTPTLYFHVVVVIRNIVSNLGNKVCNQYIITIILSKNRFVLFQLMLSIQKQNFMIGEIYILQFSFAIFDYGEYYTCLRLTMTDQGYQLNPYLFLLYRHDKLTTYNHLHARVILNRINSHRCLSFLSLYLSGDRTQQNIPLKEYLL